MKLRRYVGLLPVIFVVACATDSARFGGNTVTYQDPKGINTVSNEFNLTDMNNIAEAMAKKILSRSASRPFASLNMTFLNWPGIGRGLCATKAMS